MLSKTVKARNFGDVQRLRVSTTSSAQAKLKVDFFFDTLSPYTWPAFEQLVRYKDIWNIDINFKPFSYSSLIKDTGN